MNSGKAVSGTRSLDPTGHNALHTDRRADPDQAKGRSFRSHCDVIDTSATEGIQE